MIARVAAALLCLSGSVFACPDTGRLTSGWIEERGMRPQGLWERHLSRAAGPAAPLLVDTPAGSFWLGLSYRGGGESCFLDGSVAYYVVGREEDPELNFVRSVAAGDEPSLSARLVELRWYDPTDGRRHRWLNAALAEKLGWLGDGRGGRAPEGFWPNPAYSPVNALY
ncbi:MAG: hypothetical protein HY077_04320 [Elusimicrobia bacterium]|nr:hypothetical protein [Elusimicrobiota bacterium]